MNLGDGFVRSLSENPTAAALSLAAEVIDYAGLARQVDAVSNRLVAEFALFSRSCPMSAREQPLQALPKVAWCGGNQMVVAALYLACVRLGYALVVIDSSWSERQQRAALSHVKPFIVLRKPQDCFQSEGATVKSNLPSASKAAAEQIFLIGFTSGSSGAPKAFYRSQQSWLETFRLAAIEFPLPAASTVFAPGPLAHGLSFYAMAETLHNGGHFISLRQFCSQACLEQLCSTRIDRLVVVPSMLHALADGLIAMPADQQPAQIVSAGSKLSPQLYDRLATQLPQTEIIEYYGASELSFVSIAGAGTPAGSVGRAFAGVRIQIENPQPRTTGPAAGSVCVQSSMLAEGYLNRDGSVRSLDRINGAATVGDIGYIDEGGWLFLVDRASNRLKSGGINVLPAEVERILREHDLVEECVVLGIPDERWGDRIVAVVQPVDGQILSTAELERFSRTELEPAQRPRAWFFVTQWPLISSGKIDRQVLQQATQRRASGDWLAAVDLPRPAHRL